MLAVLMVDDMFVLANWMESPRDHVPSGEAAPVPPSPGTRPAPASIPLPGPVHCAECTVWSGQQLGIDI